MQDVFVTYSTIDKRDRATPTYGTDILIVEVLSKSTQNYDQGNKFLYYRSIPEFQEFK